MPNMDGTGPEGNKPKTGRKLGNCSKTEEELNEEGELGKGQMKRRHAKNVRKLGNGKRLNYYKTTNSNEQY